MIPFATLDKLGDDFWGEMQKDPVNYYQAGKKAGALVFKFAQDILSIVAPVAKGAALVGGAGMKMNLR